MTNNMNNAVENNGMTAVAPRRNLAKWFLAGIGILILVALGYLFINRAVVPALVYTADAINTAWSEITGPSDEIASLSRSVDEFKADIGADLRNLDAKIEKVVSDALGDAEARIAALEKVQAPENDPVTEHVDGSEAAAPVEDNPGGDPGNSNEGENTSVDAPIGQIPPLTGVPLSFELDILSTGYPTNGTRDEQEAWILKETGCHYEKIESEVAAFQFNTKGQGTLTCRASDKLVYMSMMETGWVAFFVGDGTQEAAMWASTVRVLDQFMHDGGPLTMYRGALENALEEDYLLWPLGVVATWPVPVLGEVDPSKADETRAVSAEHGIELIRISTVDVFQFTYGGQYSTDLKTREGYYYGISLVDGNRLLVDGDGTVFEDVDSAYIYPDKYFNACQVFEVENLVTEVEVHESFIATCN